jgi:hypothetical protein
MDRVARLMWAEDPDNPEEPLILIHRIPHADFLEAAATVEALGPPAALTDAAGTKPTLL